MSTSKSSKNIISTITAVIAFFISIGSFGFSLHNYNKDNRESTPDLKIIENLWSSHPQFELINEANSKLDNVPSPSYFILIPSKLVYHFKDGTSGSNLILSPVSYDTIDEQIVGNQTKDSIITCKLPSNFFGKKGLRDTVQGKSIMTNKEFSLNVITYPFLVIVSDVHYQYNRKQYRKIILSTALDNQELSSKDLTLIKQYISDNAGVSEVKLNGNESIYQTAQNQVEKNITTMFSKSTSMSDKEKIGQIVGGKSDGTSYEFILKRINQMITPSDPMVDFHNTGK